MLADVFDKLQQQPRHSRWREEKDQDDGDEKNERQKESPIRGIEPRASRYQT